MIVTFSYIGDWSNGMIGVSKTFGGSSILSSPALSKSEMLKNQRFRLFFYIAEKRCILMHIEKQKEIKRK